MVKGKKNSPVFDILDTCDQSSNFVSGENDRKCFRSWPEWDLLHNPITFVRIGVEESQSTHGLVELTPRGFQFINHPELELTHLFWSKFFGTG